MAIQKELPKKPPTATQEQIQQAFENAGASGAKIIIKPMNIIRRKALEEQRKMIERGS